MKKASLKGTGMTTALKLRPQDYTTLDHIASVYQRVLGMDVSRALMISTAIATLAEVISIDPRNPPKHPDMHLSFRTGWQRGDYSKPKPQPQACVADSVAPSIIDKMCAQAGRDDEDERVVAAYAAKRAATKA